MNRRNRLTAPLISAAAVAVAAIHLARPDLRIDGITLALAAIALIPWLGDLFESLELPGGAKIQYRKLEERLEAAEQQAEDVRLAVNSASRQARVALVTSGDETLQGEAAAERVGRLTADFTALRRRMPSGPERTYRQEQIFAELIRVTPHLTGFDVPTALASTDGGTRLSAYARLYACPEAEHLQPLVSAATTETLPFAQFWAFKAIDTVLDATDPGNVRLTTVRALRSCLAHLPPDAVDRAQSLRTTLTRLDDATT
ncbi:hypothetical protein OHS33_38480 (plasmid) [Streptomyces sp. NBC_00536]|uniref:hypothetical protein n=1 Tax=Streptomyces sp. NBC_00536 TaxID=2975769 RepID=UPI002E809541|nr:hypothetical protein [Streptomyces sp. NBC_00536]WUC84290.1 hypothetical protein OHS33_38480 [Streptomyces sp. NBC_00536]